jgi:hypothetical protein
VTARTARKKVRSVAASRTRPKRTKPTRARRPATSRWVALVAEHGVVFASARGRLPSIAELVAGEPIVGSWWAHPTGKAIFAALSAIDDSADVRSFRLVDGKITLVHRRAWPALVRLGRAGVLAADRLASLQQQHMPTGEHRTIVTPFPDWVDDETAAAAAALTVERAAAAFPSWLRA